MAKKKKDFITESFECVLREKHSEIYKGLDDEMEDDYNSWVTEELLIDDVIKWADEWANREVRFAIIRNLKLNRL